MQEKIWGRKMEKITEKDIAEAKDEFEEKEIVDDEFKDDFIKKFKEIHTNNIVLAELFLKSYDYIKNFTKFKIEDKDIENLRKELYEYGSGRDYGCSFVMERIRRLVEKNRDKKIEIILLFKKIIQEE